MTDLKPCPFCGSKKLHYSKPTPYGSPAIWCSSVTCIECGAEIVRHNDKAVEAWNRRSGEE